MNYPTKEEIAQKVSEKLGQYTQPGSITPSVVSETISLVINDLQNQAYNFQLFKGFLSFNKVEVSPENLPYSLTIGKRYIIYSISGNDDFSNVGFSEEESFFTATGTTPNVWVETYLYEYTEENIEISNSLEINFNTYIDLLVEVEGSSPNHATVIEFGDINYLQNLKIFSLNSFKKISENKIAFFHKPFIDSDKTSVALELHPVPTPLQGLNSKPEINSGVIK